MQGKHLIAGLAIIAAAGFVSAPVKATDLYNNIGASSDGADSVQAVGPLYDSFSTTAAGNFAFNHLELLVGGGGTLNVNLYGNQVPSGGPFAGSSVPGSLIANIATALSAPSSLGDVSLNFANIYLGASTRYWIELDSTNANTVWSYSFDISGTGVGTEYSYLTCTQPSCDPQVFPNDPQGAYQMDVAGFVTPLPAALPLFASGLGALGVVSWRRKRKAALAA